MARGTTEQERRESVTLVPVAGDFAGPGEDDINQAFEDWRKSFEGAEEPGKLRAYEIPIDERGNVMPTAKNQVRLGSWPIDLYGFDELCAMLIRDFMPASKILAVRLIGTKPGTAGLQFNKIIVLRAPKFNSDSGNVAPPGESVTSLMKAIQDSNERMMALVQSMRPPVTPDTSFEKIMQMSAALNAPMQNLLTVLLPVIAGRPTGGGGIGDLSGLLDVATKLADLRGGGGDESTGNDLVDTIRAVSPIIKPAIEALPSILQFRQPVTPGAVPALPNPQPQVPRSPQATVPPPASPPRAPAPGSVPTQPSPQAVGVTPTPQLSDIPSGDQQMFAQLKPQIDELVKMADQGSPAIGAADLLFDSMIVNVPDEFYEMLADFIGNPKFVENISIMNPAVAKHADWFRQFQTQIIERYEQEDKEAGATAA